MRGGGFLLFCVVKYALSQLAPLERLWMTHLGMFRTSSVAYSEYYGLTVPTRPVVPLVLFSDALYLASHYHREELEHTPLTLLDPSSLQDTRPQNCHTFQDNCTMEARQRYFCNRCRENRELVVVTDTTNSSSLSWFHSTILVPHADLFLDESVNSISLSVGDGVVVIDLASVPNPPSRPFQGGAHLVERSTVLFWVSSYPVLRVSILFYDQGMKYLDEFYMRVWISDDTFFFSIDRSVITNLMPGIEYMYYSFHANFNKKDHYSDLFPLYLPTPSPSPSPSR